MFWAEDARMSRQLRELVCRRKSIRNRLQLLIPTFFHNSTTVRTMPLGRTTIQQKSHKHVVRLRICKQENRSIAPSLLHTAAVVQMEGKTWPFLAVFGNGVQHTARSRYTKVEQWCACAWIWRESQRLKFLAFCQSGSTDIQHLIVMRNLYKYPTATLSLWDVKKLTSWEI